MPFPNAFWENLMSFVISYQTLSECTTKTNPKETSLLLLCTLLGSLTQREDPAQYFAVRFPGVRQLLGVGRAVKMTPAKCIAAIQPELVCSWSQGAWHPQHNARACCGSPQLHCALQRAREAPPVSSLSVLQVKHPWEWTLLCFRVPT